MELAALTRAIVALERPLLLALDVDGTLAPIVDDPRRAAVPADVARSLERLVTTDIVLAIVTGRDAAQLDRMLTVPAAWRVTEHGREILAPGDEPRAPNAEALARLARFEAWARTNAIPFGARVERKPGAVVVHVRELARRDATRAAELLERAASEAGRMGLVPREGRAVIEAALEHADKGRALLAVAERVGVASIVYAGDDRTDEPAIALAAERGIGIFVRSDERPQGPPGTSAVVEGPRAVAELLARLADALHPR